MTKNQNQPRKDDAVLGQQNTAPAGSVILGGLEGVKRRLASADVEQKIAALKDALKYEETGLDLVIQALQNQPAQVKKLAYYLLLQHPNPKAQQAVEGYNPYKFFQRIRTLKGHSDGVVWVSFGTDGQTFISVGKDLEIKVWNLSNQKLIRTIRLDIGSRRVKSPSVAVAMSSDGQKLCCCVARNPCIEVWNLQTGEKISILEGHSDGKNKHAGALAVSSDGQTLFSTNEDTKIKVWDLSKGSLIHTFEWHSDIVSLCLSPDNKTLFSGSYNEIILWNLQTGQPISTLELGSDARGSLYNWTFFLAVSSNGQVLLGGSIAKIKVWNLQTGQEIFSVGDGDNLQSFTAIALSSDGKTFVCGSWQNPIQVWDLETGQVIQTLAAEPVKLKALELSSDGQNLLVGCEDPLIKLWKLEMANS